MARQTTRTNEKHWYVIHTYVGYEKAVVNALKRRIESQGMQEYIFDVVIPTEKVVKVKKGEHIETEEQIYPGYILVQMIVNDESWFVVRNTPHVSGFVGSGNTPVPLGEGEVNALFEKMNAEGTQYDAGFSIGESVHIIDGPFKGMEGIIAEVHPEEKKIQIYVSMFGRETAIQLDYPQIRKA